MSKQLKNLHWHRLSVTLLNIRTSPAMTAHPFSVFQAIIKGVSLSIKNGTEPLVFFHVKNRKHTFKIRPSYKIPLEIFFFKTNMDYANQWREAFKAYLSDPETGRNFEIVEMGEIEERSFDMAAAETDITDIEGEICLEFLTPFPFNTEKDKHRTYIAESTLIRSFEKRFSKLFGRKIVYNSRHDRFSIIPYYWKYTEIRHPSKSQPGRIQYLNGCIGPLYIKGIFKDFLPFLILGSELHTGSKLSNSQGYYRLHKESPGYFERYFPNKKVILSVIRDVLDRYDHALESLSETEQFPFNEVEYAEKLCQQITENTYTPSPNTAFLIKKKGGVERMVEQLQFKDLIVQQYLSKTVYESFDRMLEKESIGFRKGISRQRSIKMVQEAIAKGYQYVIESDIEDFFPSVDIDILTRLLDFYIPQKDTCLKTLLLKSIRNGYILNGTYHNRVKGLAQGNPLSPILANLYLDSFDEQIKEWDVKMVRYADDFIILTRTKQDAENVLSKTEAFLSEIGLKIKKEKTAIKPIKDGFRFLGIRFERSEVKVESEEGFKQLKKPLYITEPHLFLSLNGDAIDIRRYKAIVETIPIRRISEIMVMERSVLSTAIIRKCTDNNIPLTVVLNSGYYITTIKPDSKKYYDISFEHARKHYSLSETEILCIAKEFAAGKINNYISLFRQRYVKGQNLFIRELKRVVENIHQAGDVHQVRGFEGAVAKKIYQRLNTLIDHDIFHIKKRGRRKPDRINSMLNFGYYLLFSCINATVRATGLNPYLGFLHSPQNNYESLVCDIEELFRPRLNRCIIRMINLRTITKDDFAETDRGMYLKREAIKRFIDRFEAEMNRKNSKNTLSLKESIYVQVAVIKKWVLENASLSFYSWKV
ncbi:MAG: CRISPR-associated endonuclease Cas1 [Thermodesulfobacteriota bacterium]